MAIAIIAIAIVSWTAIKPAYEKNGFNRQLAHTSLTLANVTNKEDGGITDISGITPSHIYFSTRIPGKLWVTDNNLENGHYITIHIPGDPKTISAFTCIVDSPTIYILEGNTPAVITGQLVNNETKEYKFSRAAFTRAIAITPYSYIVRGLDSTAPGDQIFIKHSVANGETKRANNLVERRHDLGISTDGFLNYDPCTHLAIYTSYYCNKFLCIDTSLNLVYTGHTIDTVASYGLKAGITGHTLTNASPITVINSSNCTYNGKLYNVSRLKADNETAESFDDNSAIDIYDIKTGHYDGSIYVPSYKSEKIKSFKVGGNSLVVNYKNYIARYQLAPMTH